MQLLRYAIIYLAIILGAILIVHAVKGEEAPVAKPDGAWFKSLRQNITGASCCDISDCHQTKADWHNGQWWADVQGWWTPIPNDKVLENKFAADGEAYVCSGYDRRIYCFIPKNYGF